MLFGIRASLTRISHKLSTVTAYMPASTALRSPGLLNIPSGSLSSSSLRAPCACRHLRCFATILCEKCGLEAAHRQADRRDFRAGIKNDDPPPGRIPHKAVPAGRADNGYPLRCPSRHGQRSEINGSISRERSWAPALTQKRRTGTV
jgi:hypothetical protein